jgi:dephospho-CoA kinase
LGVARPLNLTGTQIGKPVGNLVGKLIGLTGNIGSGKSTVAQMFAARGVPVIDADGLARELQAPGQPAHSEIAAAWPEVVGPDGRLDRRRLSNIVFADSEALKRLEAMMHPRIQTLSRARADAFAEAGHGLVLYEASLLVESGRDKELDGLIVVTASPATRMARVVARDGVREEDVRARMRAQLPQEDKVRLATHVIDNDGDLAATEAQVDRVLAELRS